MAENAPRFKSIDPTDLHAEIDRLQQRVEMLASRCEQLWKENLILKARCEEWSREQVQWNEKTTIAKNQVEAMIARLKAMGHES